MDQLKALLKSAAGRYNKLLPHHDDAQQLVVYAHMKLAAETTYDYYGDFAGHPSVPYGVFAVRRVVSRPVRPDLYIADPDDFAAGYKRFGDNLRAGPESWSDAEIKLANDVVYTSVMAVACCYDVWQRGSRKTPGTVFEILMASLFQLMLPKAAFSKHIPLAALLGDESAAAEEQGAEEEASEDEGGPGSVSTDLVIKRSPVDKAGIVIPLKITTRERIVQPFAHQRILDSAFGAGAFRSLIVCISETQLDDEHQSVKQVCVPGTVKLFQKYLAPISGLYYCDIPQRYAAPDMQRVLPVQSVGHLFHDVARMLND